MRHGFHRSAPAIAFILLLAVHAAVAAEDAPDLSQLTLERIFEEEEFEVETFGPARWLEDGSGYTTLEASGEVEEAKEIVRYDPATGKRSVPVPATSLVPTEGEKPLEIDDYLWSEDGRRLLIFTNTEKVWRRNTRGDYWLLDIGTGKLQQLGGEAGESSMMFAKLSPDGTKVAWVDFSEKDLYVQDLGSLEVTRLTNDKGEHIINGTSDWVYEEEFDVRDGFRWSPDSQLVAYWQFDSEGVGTFNLINNTDALYPELIPIPYPKVGTTNSACRVGSDPGKGWRHHMVRTRGGPSQPLHPEDGLGRKLRRDLAHPAQPAAEHRQGDARKPRHRRPAHGVHRQ